MSQISSLEAFEQSVIAWRRKKDEDLRAEDGWLSLMGLFWLRDGINSIGRSAACDIVIDDEQIPERLGSLEFHGGQVRLTVDTSLPVMVDGAEVRSSLLLPDVDANGPSKVQIGAITFFVIRRGDEWAVRVRNKNHPSRLSFAGRNWFPIDPRFVVTGRFISHTPVRMLEIPNSSGQIVSTANPGRVEFRLFSAVFSLEAFEASADQIWFVFKDATSGDSTYGAGRFLYATLGADGSVTMDFNRAYHPPCAFTDFATCPFPPAGNILPIAIQAGERY